LPLNKSGHDGPDSRLIIGLHLLGLDIEIIPEIKFGLKSDSTLDHPGVILRKGLPRSPENPNRTQSVLVPESSSSTLLQGTKSVLHLELMSCRKKTPQQLLNSSTGHKKCPPFRTYVLQKENTSAAPSGVAPA
jgi:hypothetical protein